MNGTLSADFIVMFASSVVFTPPPPEMVGDIFHACDGLESSLALGILTHFDVTSIPLSR